VFTSQFLERPLRSIQQLNQLEATNVPEPKQEEANEYPGIEATGS